MKHILFSVVLVLLAFTAFAQRKNKTENVILITLDGMRWQEVFGGAEQRLITKKFVGDTSKLAKTYLLNTPEQRREKLMPFFWNVIGKQGQLYGNRKLGNKVNVTNKMWFSYPGYNEILSGAADDARITSNDANDNPNKTVLEFINGQKGYEGKVVAFTSWEAFPAIVNSKRSGVYVNGGLTKATNPNEREKMMNELMFQLPDVSGETRLDAFTFNYAMEYLQRNKPKVMYISFDETDHFAHAGMYDRYLASAHYTDGFIKQLWDWLQSQPAYKDKTTLIITTDHGRGNISIDDWRHHGSKMAECDQIWFAFLGPDTEPLGEMKTEQQLYQNQVAAMLARFLNFEYTNETKPGETISSAIKSK
ncbi:hypothetical protein WSM22_34870 [Cytophagales bacterium WSM2-2]|nr:hypothetical protein WSM22_34870 [Cytophagales bacterium WSM2-2]